MDASPRFAPRSLFLGHGAPTLALSAHPAADALRELGRGIAPPRAAVVVSPHRAARGFDVGHAPRFEAWHDFGGFGPGLHALRDAPAGDPALAQQVLDAIRAAGLPGVASDDARIDHGIWVPLRLMWPEAQVPVVPVSPLLAGPAAHLALGRALRPLAEDGVLVIGTGSLTHNLGDIVRWEESAPVAAWTAAFDDWFAARLAAGDTEALLDYRARAPHAAHAHPTEEHLMPLFVALGAGGAARPRYRGTTYGTLSMASYAFQ